MRSLWPQRSSPEDGRGAVRGQPSRQVPRRQVTKWTIVRLKLGRLRTVDQKEPLGGRASVRRPLTVSLMAIAAASALRFLETRHAEPLGSGFKNIVYGHGISNFVYVWGFGSAVYIIAKLPMILASSPSSLVRDIGAHLTELNRAFNDVVGAAPLWFVAAGIWMIYIVGTGGDPIGNALLTVGMWGSIFLIAMRHLASEKGRDEIYTRLRPLGIYAPFLYSSLITWLAVGFFTALTTPLHKYDFVRFASPAGEVTSWRIASFFCWHLADSIPLANVPETAKWPEPLHYDDVRLGLIVLVFKIVVIAPILASFQAYWIRRHAQAEAATDEEDQRPAREVPEREAD